MLASQALIDGGHPEEALTTLAEIEPVVAELLPGVLPELELWRAAAHVAAGAGEPALTLLARARTGLGSGVRPAVMLLEARARTQLRGDGAELLDAVVETASAIGDTEVLWQALAERAAAAEHYGRTADALRDWTGAADGIGAPRRVPLGYRLDSFLLRRRLPVLRSAIRAAARLADGDASIACRLIETAKARSIAVVLSLPPRQPALLSAEEAELEGLAQAADSVEYAAYRNRGWTPELRTLAAALQRQRAATLERLRLRDLRLRELSEPPSFDVDGAREHLATARQSAFTLFHDPERKALVTVLIDPAGVAVGERSLDETTYTRLDRYLDTLVAERPQRTQFDPSAALGILAEHLIPRELLHRAVHAESLLIAPHGPLHLLPWPALKFKGRRLLEYLPVGMLPNLACLSPLLSRQLASEPQAALFGDPAGAELPPLSDIPGLGPELDDLTQLYHGRPITDPVRGAFATQAGLVALAQRSEGAGAILHVGCHGTFEQEDPMSSGLLLAGGKLDAAEISRLHIPYGEVVLSSCSTGWRPSRAAGVDLLGDDALGLVAAFLEAGAASVVACIPPAFDAETRKLMVAYHRRRFGGEPPLSALRGAQLELIGEGTAPYKITGFVVTGHAEHSRIGRWNSKARESSRLS